MCQFNIYLRYLQKHINYSCTHDIFLFRPKIYSIIRLASPIKYLLFLLVVMPAIQIFIEYQVTTLIFFSFNEFTTEENKIILIGGFTGSFLDTVGFYGVNLCAFFQNRQVCPTRRIICKTKNTYLHENLHIHSKKST